MANNVSVRLYGSDRVTYTDVTSYVTNVSITAGKSRALDYYEPASASVSFNNYSRVFDPTNTLSPLTGYLKPKQRVYIHIDDNALFSGLIDDWSFLYNVDGQASANLQASDKSTFFANQYLPAQSFPQELSGARINRILDSDYVEWPSTYGSRNIDVGTQLLDADSIESGTNVLDYLRQIEASEQGQLYITGQDSLVFEDNSVGISSIGGFPVFSDNSNGYFYEGIDVSYTSQLLYNRFVINAWDKLNSVTANIPTSQELFGINNLNIDGILYVDNTKLINLASFLITRYSEPEYRINSITVNMFDLAENAQITLRNRTTLNAYAQVEFKPNGTGTAIEKYVRIIGINHEATLDSHLVTYYFESIKTPSLNLDDTNFGKLDYYVLGL